MLKLDGAPFTTGRTSYCDEGIEPHHQNRSAIYVQVRLTLDGTDIDVLALVDTGAQWCILEPEYAAALGLSYDDGEEIRYSTRLGQYHGRLQQVSLTLIAEVGDSLDVEATVVVSRDWPGGNFLGYTGFFQRIRFAVDPSTNSFHFGPL